MASIHFSLHDPCPKLTPVPSHPKPAQPHPEGPLSKLCVSHMHQMGVKCRVLAAGLSVGDLMGYLSSQLLQMRMPGYLESFLRSRIYLLAVCFF